MVCDKCRDDDTIECWNCIAAEEFDEMDQKYESDLDELIREYIITIKQPELVILDINDNKFSHETIASMHYNRISEEIRKYYDITDSIETLIKNNIDKDYKYKIAQYLENYTNNEFRLVMSLQYNIEIKELEIDRKHYDRALNIIKKYDIIKHTHTHAEIYDKLLKIGGIQNLVLQTLYHTQYLNDSLKSLLSYKLYLSLPKKEKEMIVSEINTKEIDNLIRTTAKAIAVIINNKDKYLSSSEYKEINMAATAKCRHKVSMADTINNEQNLFANAIFQQSIAWKKVYCHNTLDRVKPYKVKRAIVAQKVQIEIFNMLINNKRISYGLYPKIFIAATIEYYNIVKCRTVDIRSRIIGDKTQPPTKFENPIPMFNASLVSLEKLKRKN